MGNQLINPVTEKVTSTFMANDLIAGISGMQGFRKDMEDTNIVTALDQDHSLFAVFDGHCGDAAAKFAEQHFVQTLMNSKEWLLYIATKSPVHLTEALTQCFLKVDADMKNDPSIEMSGCTAVVVLITPTLIVCANAGDSRAVMSKHGEAVALSHDHKPDNPDETARILANGGYVQHNRVNGVLAVSRAFGDFELKPYVSCLPDFQIQQRNPGVNDFIIIACDGMWDVFSNKDAINEVRAIIYEGETDIALIAEEMVDLALNKGSNDNISAIIIKLSGMPVFQGAEKKGVLQRREKRALEAAEAEAAEAAAEAEAS